MNYGPKIEQFILNQCKTPLLFPSFASEASIAASWANLQADTLQFASSFSNQAYQLLCYLKDYHSIGHYATVANESEIFVFEANDVSILITIGSNQKSTHIMSAFSHLVRSYCSKLIITVINEGCLWLYFIQQHFRLTS